MNHKIRIKLHDYSKNSFSFGRHYRFIVSYYFREIGQWTNTQKEIDEVSKRMTGKLSKTPRHSGFYA